MSLNAHLNDSHGAQLSSLSHKVPILSMVVLCATVDAAGIRYLAQNWETLSAYVPHALLGIGLGAIAWRIRSVLKND